MATKFFFLNQSKHFFFCDGFVFFVGLCILSDIFLIPQLAFVHARTIFCTVIPCLGIRHNPRPERICSALNWACFVGRAALVPQNTVAVFFFKQGQYSCPVIIVSPAAIFLCEFFYTQIEMFTQPQKIRPGKIHESRSLAATKRTSLAFKAQTLAVEFFILIFHIISIIDKLAKKIPADRQIIWASQQGISC